MKTCSRCKQGKPYSDFYRDVGHKDGYRGVCKVCYRVKEDNEQFRQKKREYMLKKYHSRTPQEKERQKLQKRDWVARTWDERRNYHYRLYGSSLDQVQKMLEVQGHVCAICRRPPGGSRPLAMDHCHTTGRIRGMLCYKCNRNMVLVDDPALMSETINYAKRSQNE